MEVVESSENTCSEFEMQHRLDGAILELTPAAVENSLVDSCKCQEVQGPRNFSGAAQLLSAKIQESVYAMEVR